ncbi:hypothetical protein QQF64_036425, partial [Cirrhinus molitorella]
MEKDEDLERAMLSITPSKLQVQTEPPPSLPTPPSSPSPSTADLEQSTKAVKERLLGMPKYPALRVSNRDTGERFGLEYVEPGCRPVNMSSNLYNRLTSSAQPVPSLSSPFAGRAELPSET